MSTPETVEPTAPNNQLIPLLRGVAGAIVGAVAGVLLFNLAYSYGIYMLALPGAIIGLACGFASRIRSIPLGVLCGIAALAVGLYVEWTTLVEIPFAEYLGRLGELQTVSKIMLALGTTFGAWFGFGR